MDDLLEILRLSNYSAVTQVTVAAAYGCFLLWAVTRAAWWLLYYRAQNMVNLDHAPGPVFTRRPDFVGPRAERVDAMLAAGANYVAPHARAEKAGPGALGRNLALAFGGVLLAASLAMVSLALFTASREEADGSGQSGVAGAPLFSAGEWRAAFRDHWLIVVLCGVVLAVEAVSILRHRSAQAPAAAS
ncbi:MAG: hypothetical protein HY719_14265 [Planctomycetes bacterium]|nr:hypothetical protein [Planctomycetota bacterium]